ncbi:flagellar hook-length control protein FliK [Sphingomonas sp. DG1-23]|nr:flagellar hook-length control protein FliK [Sphingomonas sp. DG1-23]
MIQLSSLLPMPHGPVRPVLLASGGTSSFVLAPGALVLPTTKGESAVLPSGRQELAQAGKDLPEQTIGIECEDSAEERHAPEDGADIAFAWFATTPVPQPASIAAALVPAIEIGVDASAPRPQAAAALADLSAVATLPSEAGAAPELPSTSGAPERAVAPATLPTLAIAEQAQVKALPNPTGDPSAVAVPTAPASPRPASKAGPTIPSATVGRAAAPITQIEQRIRPAEAPAPTLEVATRPAAKAPAQLRRAPAQDAPEQARTVQSLRTPILAPPPAAIDPAIVTIAASVPPAPAPAPLRRAPAMDSVAPALLPAAPEAAPRHAVPAAADIQHGALDTRGQEWTGRMVEHIEALRDAAPVRETRLSLAPEALGKVDVSIRHEGDRVHVHFTTETPAARQLIADAQPRLSELAEARGLKLGQTSFESGAAGQGPNREGREQSAPRQPLAPRPVTDSAVGAADDDRIA